MARFDIVAELHLRGPNNITSVVNGINKQLQSIKSTVDVKAAPRAVKDIKKQLSVIKSRIVLDVDSQAVNKLNSKIRGINSRVNVKVNITSGTSKKIAVVTKNLRGMSAALVSVRDNAQQAAAALKQMSGSVGSSSNAIAKSQKGMQKLSNSTKSVGKNVLHASDAIEKFGHDSALAVRRFAGFTLSAGIFVGITASIRSGVSAMIDFQHGVVKLEQVTKASKVEIRDLTKEITRLAVGLGVSSQELLDVSRILAQTGLTVRETKIALEALAKSSLAPTFTDMQNTAEGAVAAMAQFGKTTRDLEGVLGSINNVAGKFAVESDDIIFAIRRAGGAFRAAGGDIEELIALFTAVRSTTRESAETIATGFRTIFTRIQRGTTIDLLKELGVELRDAERQFIGPFQAITKIGAALSDLESTDPLFSKIIEELGGFRQVSKVIPLIQQTTKAQRALREARSPEGRRSLEEDSITAQKALAVQITKVHEQFLALFRDTGAFEDITTLILRTTSSLITMAETLKGILPGLGLIAAFRGVNVVNRFAKGFSGGISGLNKFGEAADSGVFNKVGNINEKLEVVQTKNNVALTKNTTALTILGKKVDRLAIRMVRGSGLRFNTGGTVPGVGDTDSIPALLTPGEFVINKDAAKKIGGRNLSRLNNIDKLNRGGYPSGGVRKLNKGSKGSLSDEVIAETVAAGRAGELDMSDITRNLRLLGIAVAETAKAHKEYTSVLRKSKRGSSQDIPLPEDNDILTPTRPKVRPKGVVKGRTIFDPDKIFSGPGIPPELPTTSSTTSTQNRLELQTRTLDSENNLRIQRFSDLENFGESLDIGNPPVRNRNVKLPIAFDEETFRGESRLDGFDISDIAKLPNPPQAPRPTSFSPISKPLSSKYEKEIQRLIKESAELRNSTTAQKEVLNAYRRSIQKGNDVETSLQEAEKKLRGVVNARVKSEIQSGNAVRASGVVNVSSGNPLNDFREPSRLRRFTSDNSLSVNRQESDLRFNAEVNRLRGGPPRNGGGPPGGGPPRKGGLFSKFRGKNAAAGGGGGIGGGLLGLAATLTLGTAINNLPSIDEGVLDEKRGRDGFFQGRTGSTLSGTLSGAAAGASAGALLGSVGGPIGTGIGAAIGGIAGSIQGFRSSLDEFDKSLQKSKAQDSLTEISDAVGDFIDVSNKPNNTENAIKAREALSRLDESIGELEDTSGSLGLTDFKLRSKQLAGTGDELQKTVQRFVEEGLSFDDIKNKLGTDSKGKSNLDFISRIIAEQKISDKDLEKLSASEIQEKIAQGSEEYRKELEEQIVMIEKVRLAELNRRKELSKSIIEIDKLSSALQRISAVSGSTATQLTNQAVSSAFSTASGNAGRIQVVSRESTITNRRFDPRFADTAQSLINFGGKDAKLGIEKLVEFDSIEKQLGRTIQNLVAEGVTEPDKIADFIKKDIIESGNAQGKDLTDLAKRIEKSIGNIKDIVPTVKGGDVESVISKVREETGIADREKRLIELEKQRVSILQQVIDKNRDLISIEQDLTTSLIGVADKRQQIINRRTDRGQELGFNRRLPELINRGTEGFRSNQRLLAGSAGGEGLDPSAIGASIRSLDSKIQSTEVELSALTATAEPGSEEVINLTRKLNDLNTSVSKQRQALQNLTQDTTALSIAQQRLTELQQAEQSRFGIAEKLLTGGPKEISDFNRQLGLAKIVAQTGNISGVKQEDRQGVLGLLKEFGQNEIVSGTTGEKAVQNVLKGFISSNLQGLFVDIDKQAKESKLANETINNTLERQFKAQTEIALNTLASKDLLTKTVDLLNQSLKIQLSKAKEEGFNSGGLVGGIGNSDKVSAKLTPGEFVVNKKDSRKNFSLLKAINGGMVQKYQQGGEVNEFDNQAIQIGSVNGVQKLGNLSGQLLNFITQGDNKFDEKDKKRIFKIGRGLGFKGKDGRETLETAINKAVSGSDFDRFNLFKGLLPNINNIAVSLLRATQAGASIDPNNVNPKTLREFFKKIPDSYMNTIFEATRNINSRELGLARLVYGPEIVKQVNIMKAIAKFKGKRKNKEKDELEKQVSLIDPNPRPAAPSLPQTQEQVAKQRAKELIEKFGPLGGIGVPLPSDKTGLARTPIKIPISTEPIDRFPVIKGDSVEFKKKRIFTLDDRMRMMAAEEEKRKNKDLKKKKNKGSIFPILPTVPIGFNTGGGVPGSGRGDIVPALLEPGEFVINRKAAQMIGMANLRNMNNVNKFQNGGSVSNSGGGGGSFSTPMINMREFSYSIDKFSNSVSKLSDIANILSKIPSEITHKGNHEVNVNVTGTPALKEFIVNVIDEQLARSPGVPAGAFEGEARLNAGVI